MLFFLRKAARSAAVCVMSIDRAATSAGLASEIVLKLSHESHTFAGLVHVIRGVSDSVMTAALSELVSDGYAEHVGARFKLSPRGRDLIARCRPGRRNRVAASQLTAEKPRHRSGINRDPYQVRQNK
jgi:DNA-binding HxlR family transcriptional regulator